MAIRGSKPPAKISCTSSVLTGSVNSPAAISRSATPANIMSARGSSSCISSNRSNAPGIGKSRRFLQLRVRIRMRFHVSSRRNYGTDRFPFHLIRFNRLRFHFRLGSLFALNLPQQVVPRRILGQPIRLARRRRLLFQQRKSDRSSHGNQ